MENVREIKTKEIFRLCCGDAGRAFIYGIIASFLLIFYIPSEGVTAIEFLPKAALTLGVIKAIGVVWDAITDPIVASISDKFSKHSKKGERRIPLMKFSFVPYAILGLLVFFAPVNGTSMWNAVYLCVILLLFYTASTIYYIPYGALQIEVVNEPKKRVFFYTINSLMYVVSSALVYSVYVIKSILTKNGFSYEWSYRIPFMVFTLLGLILTAIPALTIKENELVKKAEDCHVPLFKSLVETFKYKNFLIIVLGYLVMWVGLTFFNSALAYYVTVLLGFDESIATVVLAIAIIVGVATYPLINILAKKIGKRKLLIAACIAYTILYLSIYFYATMIKVVPPMVYLITLGVLVAMPISITNIIPASCFGDCAQYDYVKTGVKKTGMFVASKNFVSKLSDAIVVILVSAVITLGSANGSKATVQGVRLTALIAAISVAVAIILYFFYDDKKITKEINEFNEQNGEENEI